MRWSLALLGLVAACSRNPTGQSASAPIVNLPANTDSADEESPAAEPTTLPSCAVNPPELQQHALGSLISLGALMGKTWALAYRVSDGGRDPVLVHLDRRGRLLETPLPAFTEDVAFEPPHTIHFLEYAPSVRWWSVDVSTPDAPKVSAAAAGPALGFDTSSRVKAFAVFGGTALISVYRVKYGGPKTIYAGETALYDRASAARIGRSHPFTTWGAECGRFGCAGLASNEQLDSGSQFVTLDRHAAKKRAFGSEECASVAHWRDGAHWLLARATAETFRVVSVDLTSGALRERSDPELSGCRSLQAARLGGRGGVTIAGKEFVPIDSQPRIFPSEPLPEFVGRSQELAPLPDGALVIDFSADSWLKHGPTDARGTRRYHREWKFAGRAGLLRSAAGRTWQLESISRLPGDDSEGQFYGELDANVLSNGNYGAAIVNGAGKSQVVLLSRPCD